MPDVTSEECSCCLQQRTHWGVGSTALTGCSAWAWGLLCGVFPGLRTGPQQLRRPGGARRCPADTALSQERPVLAAQQLQGAPRHMGLLPLVSEQNGSVSAHMLRAELPGLQRNGASGAESEGGRGERAIPRGLAHTGVECEHQTHICRLETQGSQCPKAVEPAPLLLRGSQPSRKRFDWLGEAHTLWSLICFIY